MSDKPIPLALVGRLMARRRSGYSRGLTEERRRAAVSRLMSECATEMQIVERLAAEGEVNPSTGLPWSWGTVSKDIDDVEALWRARASLQIEDLRGRQLMQLRELERRAWAIEDYDLVLDVLREESALLGLKKPLQIDITVQLQALAVELGVSYDEAVREAQRMSAAISPR